jgi:hypothetical protein
VFFGVGLIFFAIFVLMRGRGSVPECVGRESSLLGTASVVNSCDFAVNATVCVRFPFNQNGSCSGPSIYHSGQIYAIISTKNTGILTSAVVPSSVEVYSCRKEYTPKITNRAKGEYLCE